MGWTNWPVSDDSTIISAWSNLSQLWFAIRERVAIFKNPPYCCNHFPHRNQDWYVGTINGITATTLTCSAASWITNDLKTSFGGADWLPTLYDIVIDDCDPQKVVRAHIISNTTSTLTISDISKYVVGKWVGALSDLIGKTFYIIKRDGLWWSERWLQWSNDNDLRIGTCSGGSDTTPSRSWIEDSVVIRGDFTGKDLVVYGDDGLLHRLSITSNDSHRIYFAHQSFVASGNYSIVGTSSRSFPGRIGGPWARWYGGVKTNSIAHDPVADAAGSFPIAAETTIISMGTPPDCADVSVDAMDVDVWTAVNSLCDTADECLSPFFYSTLRSLQVWLEENCSRFVEKKLYTGETSIPTFTAATFFKKVIPANSGTATVSGPDGSSHYYITIASPLASSIYYTVKKSNGDNLTSGSTTIDGSGKAIISGVSGGDVGKVVIWSYGWSFWYPREFRFIYKKTCFIPDTDFDDVIDPPLVSSGCNGAGTWIKRSESTSYAESDTYGGIADSGGSFVTNSFARYIGDNWQDARIGNYTSSSSDSLTPYYDKFAVTQHPPIKQTLIKSDLNGVVATSTTSSITDIGKSWHDPKWYIGGTLRTESGMASGGSSNTLIDSSKSTSCFWKPARFNGFTSPWSGFVLEVDRTVSGVTTTYKAPISSCSGYTLTLSVALPISISSGDVYRIVEPKYELNRYEGRALKIIEPDGTTHDATITNNDANTLWFTPATSSAVPADSTYAIADPEIGTTWKWDGSKWIVPTTDSRGATPLKDQTANLPTMKRHYGRIRRGAYLFSETLNQIYNAINALEWTENDANNWCYTDASGTDHYNQWVGASRITDYLSLPSWGEATGQSEDAWTDTTYTPSRNAARHIKVCGTPPNCSYTGAYWFTDPDDNYAAGITRTFAYASIGGLNSCKTHSVDWYAYAVISSSDPDASSSGDHKAVFNNNSDDDGGSFQYRKFVKWGSNSTSSLTTEVSPACGNTDPSIQPNVCPEPTNDHAKTDPHDAATSVQGYYISQAIAVVKWDLEFTA